MTRATFLLLFVGVVLNAGAQLLLKAGVTPLGALSVGLHNAVPTALRVLSQWQVVVGLACYVVSAAIWIVGLSRVAVSIAYPMLSLGYVINLMAAWWLFGETPNLARCAGVFLILIGVLLVSRS